MNLFKKNKKECNQCNTCKRLENHCQSDTFYRDDDEVRFKLSFGIADGNRGEFIGTTKEIREQIENHIWNFDCYYHRWDNNGLPTYKKEWGLRLAAENISFLKYGYFWEFKEIYHEVDYTIDNCFGITIEKL